MYRSAAVSVFFRGGVGLQIALHNPYHHKHSLIFPRLTSSAILPPEMLVYHRFSVFWDWGCWRARNRASGAMEEPS